MPLSFPVKENVGIEKALFDWPIVLQYDVKAKYRLISRKLSGIKFISPECLLNQPKATRICIHSINQSDTSISVHLLFLFVCAFSFQGHTKITFNADVNVTGNFLMLHMRNNHKMIAKTLTNTNATNANKQRFP